MHTHSITFALLFLASSSSSSLSQVCDNRCGNFSIPYPFYLPNQPKCGVTGFQLSCPSPETSTPLLRINHARHQVIALTSANITINPLPYQTSCNDSNLLSFNLTDSPFLISQMNMLQLRHCNRSCSASCSIPYLDCNASQPSCCQNLYPSTFSDALGTTMESFTEGYRSLRNFSTRFKCSSFTSWAYSPLDYNTSLRAEYGLSLNWSIPGDCSQNLCAQHAKCINTTEIGTTEIGHLCICEPGYTGDGYSAGRGCTAPGKISGSTSISNSTVKWAAITAGIIAIATIIAGVVIACAVLKSRSSFALARDRKAEFRGLCALLSQGRSKIFSYRQLEKATNGFASSEKLGNGACGTVYAGILEDNRRVAVKRIHYFSSQGIQQIVNEVNVLSAVQHRNLVRLLGCCVESSEPLLVFEFVSNGTLAEHLQRERGDGLDWLTRLTIAAETADALAYLHAMNPPIFHRDVKSRNILLDEDFNTKVADFGLSRMGLSLSDASHISTTPQGTPGYLDPEYHQNFHLSDKSDVYSFGVVLIEIITALKPVDFSRAKKEVNLAALAVAKIGSGRLDDIIDKFLEADEQPSIRAMVQRVAELAFRCLAFDKDARPAMAEVLEELLLIRGSRTHRERVGELSRRIDTSSSAVCIGSSAHIDGSVCCIGTKSHSSESGASETERFLGSELPKRFSPTSSFSLETMSDQRATAI